jgi:hypothetical protein
LALFGHHDQSAEWFDHEVPARPIDATQALILSAGKFSLHFFAAIVDTANYQRNPTANKRNPKLFLSERGHCSESKSLG